MVCIKFFIFSQINLLTRILYPLCQKMLLIYYFIHNCSKENNMICGNIRKVVRNSVCNDMIFAIGYLCGVSHILEWMQSYYNSNFPSPSSMKINCFKEKSTVSNFWLLTLFSSSILPSKVKVKFSDIHGMHLTLPEGSVDPQIDNILCWNSHVVKHIFTNLGKSLQTMIIDFFGMRGAPYCKHQLKGWWMKIKQKSHYKGVFLHFEPFLALVVCTTRGYSILKLAPVFVVSVQLLFSETVKRINVKCCGNVAIHCISRRFLFLFLKILKSWILMIFFSFSLT